MTDRELMQQALEALEAKGDAWIVLERKAKAAIREALAEQPAQQQEPVRVPVADNTYNYAKSLAEAIFKQHFASDEHYSSGRIVWGVNDTVIGILTQIDNMVADMVRRPAQVDGDTIVQTFTGLPRRKLRDLLSGGWEVNGVCFQRIETDGTVRRGAATTGGMVLWWNAEQPAQQEPVAFLANGTRFKISYDSRQSGGQIHGIPPELGGRWVAFVAADDDCHLKLTSPQAQRKPLTLGQKQRLWSSVGDKPTLKDRVNAYGTAIEAAHGIGEKPDAA